MKLLESAYNVAILYHQNYILLGKTNAIFGFSTPKNIPRIGQNFRTTKCVWDSDIRVSDSQHLAVSLLLEKSRTNQT